jgi:hypothetical protein
MLSVTPSDCIEDGSQTASAQCARQSPPAGRPEKSQKASQLHFKNTQNKISKISFSFKLAVFPVSTDIASEFGRNR